MSHQDSLTPSLWWCPHLESKTGTNKKLISVTSRQFLSSGIKQVYLQPCPDSWSTWVWLIESLVTWCCDISKTKNDGCCHKCSNNQRRFKIRITSSVSQPSAQLLKCGHDIFFLCSAVTTLKNGQARVSAKPCDVTGQTSPPNSSASTFEPNLSRFSPDCSWEMGDRRTDRRRDTQRHCASSYDGWH